MEAKLPVLRARLGAARLALSQHAPGSPAHGATSRAQARAVIDLAVRCSDSLTPECRAIVVEVAATVPWHGQDGVAVAQVLAGPEISSSSSRRRTQNYINFLLYLPAWAWDRLTNPEVSLTAKETIIFTILIKLGLRNPKEHSAKAVTSFCLMLDRPYAECIAMKTKEKQKYNSVLKADFKRRTRGIPDTIDYPVELPEDPLQFKAQYPALWSSLFAEGEGPSDPKIDLRHWKMVDGSWGCRGNGAEVAAQNAGAGSNVPTLVTTGGPIEQFGGMMMQCMQNVQQQQQHMMEILAKGNSPGPSSPTPRGLLGLLDRRLESGDGRSRLVLQDGLPGARSPGENTALVFCGREPPPTPPQALLHETLKMSGPSTANVAPPPRVSAIEPGVAPVATSASAVAFTPLAIEKGAVANALTAAPAPRPEPDATLAVELAAAKTKPAVVADGADSDDEPLTRLARVTPAPPADGLSPAERAALARAAGMVEMLTARDKERKIERDAEKRKLEVAGGAVAEVAKKSGKGKMKAMPLLSPMPLLPPLPPAPKRLRIRGKSTHG